MLSSAVALQWVQPHMNKVASSYRHITLFWSGRATQILGSWMKSSGPWNWCRRGSIHHFITLLCKNFPILPLTILPSPEKQHSYYMLHDPPTPPPPPSKLTSITLFLLHGYMIWSTHTLPVEFRCSTTFFCYILMAPCKLSSMATWHLLWPWRHVSSIQMCFLLHST